MDGLPGGMERGMKREGDGDTGAGGGGGGVHVMYFGPLMF